MPTAKFQFRLSLESTADGGVMFVDWRPKGREDAITLNTSSDDLGVLLWFEVRHGYPDDEEVREVDASTVCGEILLHNLSDDDITLLGRPHELMEDDSPAGSRYRSIVKKTVQTAHSSIARLLDRVILNYGQYWLFPAEFYLWDSRHTSLADHACLDLHLIRSIDGGTTWLSFDPSPESLASRISRRSDDSASDLDPGLYINRSDWERIASDIACMDDNKGGQDRWRLVKTLVTEVRREVDAFYFGYALILAVTALELALNQHIREKGERSPRLVSALQPLLDLRLPFKYSAIAVQLPLTGADIELTLKAVEMRNSIVHEGREVQDDPTGMLEAITRSVVALLPSDVYRTAPHPNELWG